MSLLLLVLGQVYLGTWPEYQFVTEGPRKGCIAVSLPDGPLLGLLRDKTPSSDQWRTFAGVYLAKGKEIDSSLPPMLGNWEVGARQLFFRARFPLIPGRHYRVRINEAAAYTLLGEDGPGRNWEGGVDVPDQREEAPRVLGVYPSGEQWPANILRMYIEFSKPMRQAGAYKGIRILNAKGDPLRQPFVIVPQELWDPEGRRLTVLFDPGRIKRGVGPNRSIGAPLLEGATYTLEIVGREDNAGMVLQQAYRKNFQVVAPDRSLVRPDTWQLEVPEAGTRKPLWVGLDKAYDAALIQSMVAVTSGKTTIEGIITPDAGEKRFRFTPNNPWSATDHQLHVHPHLEDRSGNRSYRLFDAPTDAKILPEKETILPFRPKE